MDQQRPGEYLEFETGPLPLERAVYLQVSLLTGCNTNMLSRSVCSRPVCADEGGQDLIDEA